MSEEIKEEKSVNVDIAKTGNKKIIQKQRVIMVAIAVVIIALVAGISIYNIPENRLTRQLIMGQKYLEEQQYEEAIVAFEQAIAIDERCVEAYLGGIEAYQRLGDVEELKAFYDKALAAVEKLESEELTENMSYVVSIYLAADEVHSDDTEKTVEILETGYQLTKENEIIKAELTEIYITLAKTYVENATYEECLKIYDRLLELDNENASILSDLENCLIMYLDFLMENEEYEEIRRLNDKYRNIVRGVNFQTYLSKIEEIERSIAERKAFMQKVYDLMEIRDYDGLQELEESDELQRILEKMEKNYLVYVPLGDEELTGTGVAIYCLNESSHYFYYGEYVEGIRSGKGATFNVNNFGGYTYFTGEWKEDAPNGQGELFFQRYMGGDGEPYQEIFSGNFVNGLCDGAMTNTTIMNGRMYDMSCNATMGIPEDRTAEFVVHIPYATQMMPEGHFIYAFDNLDGNWFFATIEKDMTMGVIGFGTGFQ